MEEIILDPAELAGDRDELDITPYVSADGVDWGEAQMTAYLAELSVGSAPVDYRIPNRQISIPLRIRDIGSTDFDVARALIQAKLALWQAQGGWLKRTLESGGVVFCDVVSAQLRLGGDWLQAHRDADIIAVITLEALPDFYEEEEDLTNHATTSGDTELVFTETTADGGDFPLGDRVRIVVDDDSGADQRGIFWAIRGRHYLSAATADTALGHNDFDEISPATDSAKTGAYNGRVVRHTSLPASWAPVFNLTDRTHTGTNRVRARAYGGTEVEARLVWDVNDLVHPTENEPVRIYNGGTFQILDLGEVRLDPSPVGDHRWTGQVQAKADTAGGTIGIDRVWICNADEAAGQVMAPADAPSAGLTEILERDDFHRAPAVLNGQTPDVGSAWVTATSGASPDDFETMGDPWYLTRSSDDDGPDEIDGRFARLPLQLDATGVRADVQFGQMTLAVGGSEFAQFGLTARHSGTALNWRFVIVPFLFGTNIGVVQAYKGSTAVAGTGFSPYWSVPGVWYTLQALIDTAGNWSLDAWIGGAAAGTVLSGYDADLAAGGSYDDGKVGLYDCCLAADANSRYYDNLVAWAPSFDAVIFGSTSAQLTTDGIIREDSTGTAYGPASFVEGDLPRMPNRSSTSTAEFLIKASRGDLTSLADPNIDDISARVHRRASHLLIPSD